LFVFFQAYNQQANLLRHKRLVCDKKVQPSDDQQPMVPAQPKEPMQPKSESMETMKPREESEPMDLSFHGSRTERQRCSHIFPGSEPSVQVARMVPKEDSPVDFKIIQLQPGLIFVKLARSAATNFNSNK
jgi:hypothetical protein